MPNACPSIRPAALSRRFHATAFALIAAVAAPAAAQTVAGAEPPPAAPAPTASASAVPPKKPRPAHVAAAGSTPAPIVTTSAPPPSLSSIAPAEPAPASTVSTTTTTVNVGPPASLACVPDCRSGFVCREGECVSACNPQCGENETCNAKRECVPRTEANDPYLYDKTRFGVGGMFGVNTSPDGVGTPFGGVVAVAVPLGSHWYSREDILATYAKTTTDDHSYVGATVSPGTASVDQSYLLIALRATAGYQVTQLVSARLGVLAGSHTLHTAHGFCGTGFVEKDDTSVAIGGTGALGFALKHADLSAVVDAYSAESQMLCSVAVTPFGAPTGAPATLVPQRQFAAQFLAQATILF